MEYDGIKTERYHIHVNWSKLLMARPQVTLRYTCGNGYNLCSFLEIPDLSTTIIESLFIYEASSGMTAISRVVPVNLNSTANFYYTPRLPDFHRKGQSQEVPFECRRINFL